MDTIIRCHVKNPERLSLLERSIRSWLDKELYSFGKLMIVDDGSPLGDAVAELAEKYNIEYWLAGGTPDTKNGLYYSLKYANSFPVFCCVDDVVFGKGIKSRFDTLLNNEIPRLGRYGIIGSFACYEQPTRNPNKLSGFGLWKIDDKILYALVGHIFSEEFSKIVISRWEDVLSGKKQYPEMCDDIWVAHLLREFSFPAYNTMEDYCQHTGMNQRTFGSNEGSEYYSKMFVGE